jgi:hypothetical protein
MRLSLWPIFGTPPCFSFLEARSEPFGEHVQPVQVIVFVDSGSVNPEQDNPESEEH